MSLEWVAVLLIVAGVIVLCAGTTVAQWMFLTGVGMVLVGAGLVMATMRKDRS